MALHPNKALLCSMGFLWAIANALGAPDHVDSIAKERILHRIGKTLESKAFSIESNFSAWPSILEAHRDDIYAASTLREFEMAVDRALGEFGISHLYIKPPSVAPDDTDRPIYKLGINGPNVVNGIRVTRVSQESPAAEAGIRKGDTLVAINGVAPARHQALKGRNGEALALEWERGGQTFQGVIVCRPYRAADPPWIEWPRKDVAVIHIQSFAKGEFKANTVHRLFREARHARAILIDLRDNYGGQLRNALILASKVMPRNAPFARHVKRTHFRKSGFETFRDFNRAPESSRRIGKPLKPAFALQRYQGKVAVLVDFYSASAADAFPASVSENGRGIVVGTKTRGALIGAREIRLSHGFRFTYPFVEVLTPNGDRLEGKGLAPNLKLDWQETIEDAKIYRRAIDALFGHE